MEREKLEELLSAHLDDELQGAERAQVERVLRDNPTARRLLEELRLTSALVGSLPRHTAPESIAEDVQQQIERRALLDYVPVHRPIRTNGRRTLMVFGTIAAMFAIMITSGWFLAAYSSRQLSEKLLAENDGKSPSTSLASKQGKNSGVGEIQPLRQPVSGTSSDSAHDKVAGAGASGAAKSEAMLAMANTETFDSKLRNRMSPELLQQHSYAQEPVQLQVVVENERQRDALVAKLTTQLSQQQFARVSDAAARNQKVIPENQALYEPGTPGVNFLNATNRQLLVRARASEVTKVLSDVEAAQPPNSQMMLNVAGHVVEGNEPIKQNLIAMSQSRMQNEETKAAKPAAVETGRERSVQADASVDDQRDQADDVPSVPVASAFLQLLGIDQKTSDELGEKMAQAAKDRAAAAKASEDDTKKADDQFAERTKDKPASPTGETSETDADAKKIAESSKDEEGGSLVANAMKRVDDSRKRESKERKVEAFATTVAAGAAPTELVSLYQDKEDEFITFVIDIAVAPKDTARPLTDKPQSGAPPKPTKPAEHNDNRAEKKQN